MEYKSVNGAVGAGVIDKAEKCTGFWSSAATFNAAVGGDGGVALLFFVQKTENGLEW